MKNLVFMLDVDIKGDGRYASSRRTAYKYSIDSWKKWCNKNDCRLFVLNDLVLEKEKMAICWQRYYLFDILDANEIYELDTAIYESTELDHGYEVIVGKNLKERLDLDMNDVIQIITPDGRFSSFKVTGFYDLGLAIINESWIIMDFETAQNLFKLDGSVTSIEIQVEDVFTADIISSRLP